MVQRLTSEMSADDGKPQPAMGYRRSGRITDDPSSRIRECTVGPGRPMQGETDRRAVAVRLISW